MFITTCYILHGASYTEREANVLVGTFDVRSWTISDVTGADTGLKTPLETCPECLGFRRLRGCIEF